MATVIKRASRVETTEGTTFAIAELATTMVGAFPVTSRAVQNYTITASLGESIGSETLDVSALPVALDAGTKLTFTGGTVATVAVWTPASSTQIDILPLTGTIAANATATTVAWRFVVGCTNAIVVPTIKNIETTNFLSGEGMEMVTTGNSKKITMDLNLTAGDQGGYLLRKVCYDKAYLGREFYFQVAFITGERHEGVLLLNSANPQGAVQDARKFSIEAQVQGSAYYYTGATEILVT